MIEVREVQTYTDGYTCQAHPCSFEEMTDLVLPHGIHEPCNHHEQDDEQVIVGHLHMVGIDLERSKQGRDDQAPQVFPSIGQHDTRYHRRQVGQCPHLPDMSCGDDDEEITRERPYHSTQGCHPLTEVEGTQQDIEAQQIDKHIPHILWEPQVVGIDHLSQGVSTIVRRGCLVGGHTAEQTVCPTSAFSCALVIVLSLLTSAHSR